MPPWPPHLYRQAAAKDARSPEVVERALSQSMPPHEMWGCSPVLTLNHLAFEAQVPFLLLRGVVSRSLPQPYRVFTVKKRSGGTRYICIPLPGLCQTQQWIVTNILAKVPANPASYAYSPGQSPLECARMHCGSKWLVKVDVMQFFESISERQVSHVFERIGYQPLVAFEMGRICTRVNRSLGKMRRRRWHNSFGDERYSISAYKSYRVGHLPQGAPTSPMLSNLAVWQLDVALTSLATENGMVYTRYADDLIFSTADSTYSREKAETLIRAVYTSLRQNRLRPRTTKTVVSPPGARKVVLGLLVDTDRPRLPRDFREKLELHIHHMESHGLTGHLEWRGFNSFGGMRAHVWGLLAYAKQIDPVFADPLIAKFLKLAWPT